jgi:nicotinamidase-related amidase
LDLRRLRKMDTGVDQWEQISTHAQWEPSRTAAVICDMWDQHWCKSATARVAEMAPRMNDVITELRRRGVLIIHCPSDTMRFYDGTPGRKLAQAAPHVETTPPLRASCPLDPARESPLPIDDSDGGCAGDPASQQGTPWRHEIDTLQIKEGDAITDSVEAFYLMRQRGITNVIVMGVHENMCVVGRPFSIRQMVYQGQNVVLIRDLTDTMYNPQQNPYVDHFTGTDLMAWHIEKYWCPTITSDQIIGGSPFRFAADTNAPRIFRNYVKLPANDTHYRRVRSYIEDTPDPDYSQASDAARAAFREMKFGVRIHWGVYAELGVGVNASWPFLKMSNEQRQAYQQFYRTFNPTNFNADAWMDLFQTNGVKVVAFTTKHHDGFSMFDTHTRVVRRVNWIAPGGPKIEDCDFAYSIMDTPFHRDIVKEITDSAHSHGMKIDLYFSHPDWYDADFRPFADHPLHDRVNKTEHPDQWDHFVQRHRQQLAELLTQYGKIDLVCLDQYFDQTAWLDLRQTMKIIRRIQPNVMFRCRGIGNYGDYYTPEGFVPGAKANTDMPWMVIYPLAGDGIWSYEPDAQGGAISWWGSGLTPRAISIPKPSRLSNTPASGSRPMEKPSSRPIHFLATAGKMATTFASPIAISARLSMQSPCNGLATNWCSTPSNFRRARPSGCSEAANICLGIRTPPKEPSSAFLPACNRPQTVPVIHPLYLNLIANDVTSHFKPSQGASRFLHSRCYS